MRRYTAGVCGIAIALCGVAVVETQAQDLRIVHFSGLINDYSPSTVSGGPYEIRGEWSAGPAKGRHSQFFSGPEHGDVRLRDYRRHSGGSDESGNPEPPHAPYQRDERHGQL